MLSLLTHLLIGDAAENQVHHDAPEESFDLEMAGVYEDSDPDYEGEYEDEYEDDSEDQSEDDCADEVLDWDGEIAEVTAAMNVLELNAVSEDLGDAMEVTVDSGAGASVANPRDLPGVALRPSAGSLRGQRYVGPGGEVIANIGELSPTLRLANGATGKITFQGADVRKPLLAVSDVNRRGNVVVFDGDNSFIIPGTASELKDLRAIVARIRGKVPLQAKNGVYTMKVWRPPAAKSGFTRQAATA